MATDTYRYLNPSSPAGGNGTTPSIEADDPDRAYNTGVVWHNARRRDLVSLNEREVLICDSDGTADTSLVMLDDTWVTDYSTDNYILIMSDTNSRPGNTWNSNAFSFHWTHSSSNWGFLIEDMVDIVLDGIQFRQTRAADIAWAYHVWIKYGAGKTRTFQNCIFRSEESVASSGQYSGLYAQYNASSASTLNIYNSVFYDFNNSTFGAIKLNNSNLTTNIYNCTLHNCSIGIERDSGTVNKTNVGAAECTTAFDGTFNIDNTCSSTTPTFVNEAGDDFQLANEDTTWKNAGTDASEAITTDILGLTRTSWDIGAYAYVTQPLSISVADCSEAVCKTW